MFHKGDINGWMFDSITSILVTSVESSCQKLEMCGNVYCCKGGIGTLSKSDFGQLDKDLWLADVHIPEDMVQTFTHEEPSSVFGIHMMHQKKSHRLNLMPLVGCQSGSPQWHQVQHDFK